MGGGILDSKAFTLIELLAIIVILAIIAVITIPIILNVIENSRRGAAIDSAYGYKDAIEKYYVIELSKDTDFKLENGTYTVSDKGVLTKTGDTPHIIPTSGTSPSGGYIVIEQNEVTEGCLTIGDYQVTLFTDNVTAEKGECTNEQPVKAFKRVNSSESPLAPGDEVVIGEEDTKQNFYVVSTNDKITVLLSKHNINVGDNKNVDVSEGFQNELIIGGSDNFGAVAFSEANYWKDRGLSYPADVYDSNSNLYQYVKSYASELNKMGANVIKGRLLTYEEANILGCNFDFSFGDDGSCSNSNNEWVYETFYMLGSAVDDNSILVINTYGQFYALLNDYIIAGVRPVIEVNTSDIEL